MTTNPCNLVVTGFMGTGKSTIGQLAAARLGLAFVDTDTEIEKQAGRTIADIFAQDGEPAFRQLEAEICVRIAGQSGQVVATGGGALLNPQIREAFTASGLVVCLTCDLDEIIRRVGNDPARPLFTVDRDQLAKRLAARTGPYNSLPHHLDTTHLTPQQAVEEILWLWQQHV
jgi:shikimate kinase